MKLFIANWKMSMPHDAARKFLIDNKKEIIKLAYEADLIFCPSYESISLLLEQLKDSPIKIGAQNCSKYEQGAYTGEVSAQSISEIGCTYTIVGHSERRRLFNEHDNDVKEKIRLLLQVGIRPIVCIGETEQERERGHTLEVLRKQLHFLEDVIAAGLVIAYEPVWAIGSGKVPTNPELEKIFLWLTDFILPYKKSVPIALIYGGSVDEESIKMISRVSLIEGFLIGSASTNFEKFKKIVLLGIQ